MANGPYDRSGDERDARGSRSSWDDNRRSHGMSDHDDRGFFERAGEQISSWFGDDEPDRGRSQRDRHDRGFFEQSRERRPQPSSNHHDRSARHRDEGYRRPYTGRSAGCSPDDNRDDGYRPMTGDYSRYSAGQPERSQGPASRDRSASAGMPPSSGPAHDRHYSEWRQRQIDELDRDYDDYRREHQSKFDSEFTGWRSTRQTKRQMLGSIAPHMQVVGSDDQPVGTVDKVRGDRVVLTKNDSPDGKHHSIGCAMIDRIEGDRVILDKKADEAKSSWGDEDRDRALFEKDNDREPGAHILDRSFSGTY
ncbi:MAG: DUF2171 domain-containing protein [Pseudomonadota bacterium]|nr:DUF2171 domain-containing protein [Pseudomonadota bacterium]